MTWTKIYTGYHKKTCILEFMWFIQFVGISIQSDFLPQLVISTFSCPILSPIKRSKENCETNIHKIYILFLNIGCEHMETSLLHPSINIRPQTPIITDYWKSVAVKSIVSLCIGRSYVHIPISGGHIDQQTLSNFHNNTTLHEQY